MRRFGEEIDKLVYNKPLKTDQQPAIRSLASAVIRERHQDISVEKSPVGEHQSNGVVERAVKSIQGQVRTLKLALESRIGNKVEEHLDIVPWLIRHAAMLLNIGQRGQDGRSAWERVKGRRFNSELPEFGERVMHIKAKQFGKGQS